MLNEQLGWWPVALSADLVGQPLGVHLLDQPLVLWRNAQAEAVAMADRCPHRGAQLSLGQVRGDVIQCPYHGWTFESNGACRAYPSQPGFSPGAASAACAYRAQEHEGLVWVQLQAGQAAPADTAAPTFALPDLSGLPQRRLIYGPFDVATSAPRAVENFLDTSHFAFVHRDWLGDAEHPEVPPYEVTHTADGRPVIEAYKAWQPRATAAAQSGDWVTYRYEVLSPYSALLTKQGDAGGPQDCYTIWACPTTPDACRLWFAQYTTDATSSDAELRDFQIAIFSQDRPVLESQQPKRLPLSGGEAHSAADRLSAAYRRYLKACGITFGVC
jgi:phenylpropionate dioxygenase-like ring-hydroxylating dioxygenase large terminal subunit